MATQDANNETLLSMFEVVATKLSPQYRRGYINRCGLLHKTQMLLKRRLTLVHAAPGYGKSSLLGQWLNQLREADICAAWLTLEEEEGAVPTFLVHVISACIKAGYLEQSVLTNIGRVDEKVSLKVLSTLFINALATQQKPLVIFIDEYNRVQSEEMDRFVRVLIRNLPQHVHMVVASRWRPQLDVENLRAHDDLLEITANDLRFSVDEAVTLLDSSITREYKEQIVNFHKYTEGWPMALQMLRIWLNGSHRRVDLIADFSRKTTDMARYLSEQVLFDLPTEEQDFLLQTAILERVNGELAQVVTGRSDSWLILEKLYERNLFLTPLEHDRQWFTYHAVFLEYLRDSLQKHQPDKVVGLHRKAALWLAGQGDVRRAVYHAENARDGKLIATILDEAGGWRMVMDGRMAMIATGLSALEPELLAEFPRLRLANILLQVKQGHIDDAYAAFKQLDIDNQTVWGANELIDYQVIENTLSDYADDRVTLEEIKQINHLKAQLPPQDHLLQALLSDSLASKCYGLRQYQQTHEACADAASHYRLLYSLYGEMFIRFKQLQVFVSQGRLDEATAIAKQNHREIAIRLGENTDLAAHNTVFWAELLLEQGHIDQAGQHINDSLTQIEQADGWFELYASAYEVAATLAWHKGGIGDVEAIVQRARAVAKSRYLKRLDILADCEQVFYWCMDGQLNAAQPLADRLALILTEARQPFHFMLGTIALTIAVYRLSINQSEQVSELLQPHRDAAQQAGDLRQLIAFDCLLAAAHHQNRAPQLAAQQLDEAAQIGLFKGFHHTYVKYAHWLLPVINAVLKAEDVLPTDKYRHNFLSELKRAMNEWEKTRLRDEMAPTQAEIEVLKELVKGYSNKKIALQLGISPNTVKYRLKGIFAKFGVAKRNDLVQKVREQGMAE
ncbi:MAG: hypothetical protein HWE26_03865 [Alteromonadaceae bacterium]|nr:hypothetical protein [Alteromonadaceae bacterium]